MHAADVLHRDHLVLLEPENSRAYGLALERMSPEPYGVTAWTAVQGASAFAESLLSCSVRDAPDRFSREGECIRFFFPARRFEDDQTQNGSGYDLNSAGVGVNVQGAIGEGWFLGVGAAFDDWSADLGDDFWRSHGTTFQAGLIVKRENEGVTLAASATAGRSSADVTRRLAAGDAKGDQDLTYFAGLLHGAMTFERGDWYWRPRADLDATYVRFGGFDEEGGGGAALAVEGENKSYVSLAAGLEAGGEVALDSGWLVRPSGGIGVTQYLTDPDIKVSAAFLSSLGVGPFTVTSEADRTYFDLSARVEMLSPGGVTIAAGILGEMSENSSAISGTLNVAIPF